MRLPYQSQPNKRIKRLIWSNDNSQLIYPQQIARRHHMALLPGIGKIIANPRPESINVDHTLFIMLASGCKCISPHCVAVSCPAECIEDGVGFVC